jgi:transcriptional regulator with XRE-family HTH domain
MTMGRAMAVVREARGMTQVELAKVASVGVSQISLIESDKRSPSIGSLKSIAAACGIDVALLFHLAGENGGSRLSELARRTLNEALGEWFTRCGDDK